MRKQIWTLKDKLMIKQLLITAFTCLMCSCGMYRHYTPPTDLRTGDLYGEETAGDSIGLGQLHWTEVFPDLRLQALIGQGLQNNSEMRIAKLRVEQAEASLTASRLAFVPSLSFSPMGTASSFDGRKTELSYHVPFEASWQLDIFGRLRNAKERVKTQVESSRVYRQAVQVGLIASIASHYYSLSVLHEQLGILEQTKEVWNETVRTTKLLMETGQYNDAAVSRAEANYNEVCATLSECRQQIRETENALSVLLGDAIHGIECNKPEGWRGAERIATGVPLLLLSQRPDVRQAELNLAAAFYTANEARSAFYPSIVLSGNAGWTNIAGSIANPGKLLLEAVGTLVQPVFQNGRLKANLRIARSQQEEAKVNFQQSLLNAGMEVNNALTRMQTYAEKAEFYAAQESALKRTVRSARILMENGSSDYLEILTAQESLLSARLSFLTNLYNEISSYITLYEALGGGSHCTGS